MGGHKVARIRVLLAWMAMTGPPWLLLALYENEA